MDALQGKKENRKKLEDLWKKWGADMSVWQKNFCGNHIYNLLKEDAIDDYMSIFTNHKHFNSMTQFLKALGRLQRLCVPRKLHPEEIEDMENAIVIFQFFKTKKVRNSGHHVALSPGVCG